MKKLVDVPNDYNRYEAPPDHPNIVLIDVYIGEVTSIDDRSLVITVSAQVSLKWNDSRIGFGDGRETGRWMALGSFYVSLADLRMY